MEGKRKGRREKREGGKEEEKEGEEREGGKEEGERDDCLSIISGLLLRDTRGRASPPEQRRVIQELNALLLF